jgi:hypothetical protein
MFIPFANLAGESHYVCLSNDVDRFFFIYYRLGHAASGLTGNRAKAGFGRLRSVLAASLRSFVRRVKSVERGLFIAETQG